jgi:hypothetical protein
MHARGAIHIAKNLSTSNSDTVNARQDGILDIVALESGRHVCCQAERVDAMHELEGVLEAKLEDDTCESSRSDFLIPKEGINEDSQCEG